ncbi:lysophospholipid acyltransferase family protein [Mongoliibacter ruber]|uniref:1-acyl-sn-glycerol-3-phosphate acyltransferase n=1 Tax=Mongoliibacter ruber TaxID=1750599 RepID=A0A2T0WW71_9BACT|nr:lysophospholipid acyltransferase family protein [Mongoliibacter ruber]PRY90938.1 1-acyl-sn-glycerol-3-phosphate acyltransferase [Mongoliibacter ruber]
MKDLFNAFLRLTVKLSLHLYFQKIRVFGKENLPKGKAVLIVCNHQNALIDPLLIATHTQLKPHFLTRASAFKNPIAAKILNYIRMIPVYRIRDGKDKMEKNKETFQKSVDILHQKGSILIFGEGGHDMKRTLRPLKKGFARIAFQTLEQNPELELLILPVGINYSAHTRSGSEVSIHFGKPFPAGDFYPKYDNLMNTTLEAMDPLVAQIPEENYAEEVEKIIENRVNITDPIAVKAALAGNLEEADHSQLLTETGGISGGILKILIAPFFLFWKKVKIGIKDPTFYATFKFVICYGGMPILLLFSIIFLIKNYNYSIIILTYWLLVFITILANRNKPTY